MRQRSHQSKVCSFALLSERLKRFEKSAAIAIWTASKGEPRLPTHSSSEVRRSFTDHHREGDASNRGQHREIGQTHSKQATAAKEPPFDGYQLSVRDNRSWFTNLTKPRGSRCNHAQTRVCDQIDAGDAKSKSPR